MDLRTFMLWFHGLATIGWAVMLLTGLKESLPYIVLMSGWALVGEHWAAWQAARAEKEAGKR